MVSLMTSDAEVLEAVQAVLPLARAAVHERQWDETYNAVLQGACTGILEWAARRASQPTDAEYDELVRRLQEIAARAANYAHGEIP